MAIPPNYFDLFDLDIQYQLDDRLLAEKYRELQRVYHPDRYAGKTSQEIRLAVQKASWVNQAYDVLKSPVKRALYLLEMQGVATETHITSDSSFLLRQMLLREQLQEAEEANDPFPALEALAAEAKADFAVLMADFAANYQAGDYSQAAETAAKMQFFAKFLNEIDAVEANLD